MGSDGKKTEPAIANVRLATIQQLRENLLVNWMAPVPSEETLRDWLTRARIPAFKTNPAAKKGGGKVYYLVAAVEKFIQSRILNS